MYRFSGEVDAGLAPPPFFWKQATSSDSNSTYGARRNRNDLLAIVTGLAAALLPALATPVMAQQRIRPPQPLSLSVEAETGWDSNVRFGIPGGPGDEVRHLSGGLRKLARAARTELAVALRLDLLTHRTVKELDAFTYHLEGDGLRRLSPRLNVHARAAAQSRTSSDVEIGRDAVSGVVPETSLLPLLPRSRSRSEEGGAGAFFALSPRTSALLDASYVRTSFDSLLLVGGSAASGSALLRRRVTPLDVGIGTLDVRRVRLGREGVWLRTVAGAWTHDASAFVTSVELGAAYATMDSSRWSTMAPVGSVKLSSLPGRGSQLVGEYRRTVSQAFGLGAILSVDEISVGYGSTFDRGFQLHFRIDQSWSTDLPNRRSRLYSSQLAATLEQPLLSGWTVGARVSKRRRDDVITVDGTGMSVFARFDFREPIR